MLLVGAWDEVEVSGHQFWARVPKPEAAMWLGAGGVKKLSPQKKLDAIIGYLEHTLHPESFEWLMELSVSDDPFDTADLSELVRVVTERFSARPYFVDTALCGVIYGSWPQIRGRLIMNGIPDPLRQLPTLYALIDVTEVMILEGMEKEEDRERYWLRTYTPPPGYSATGELPRGWDRQSEMAAFDELMD